MSTATNAFFERISDIVGRAFACVGAVRVCALRQRVTWVGFAQLNGGTARAVRIAGVTRETATVSAVALSHTDSVGTASVDARVKAVVLIRTGFVVGTVAVGDTLDAPTALALVVGVTHVQACLWAPALGLSVYHDANRPFAALQVSASVDAFANAVGVRQTQIVRIGAVDVGVAAMDRNGNATGSALRVAGESRVALALTLVLERHTS